MNDHAGCAQQLHDGMAPIEITVSTEKPLVIGPYTTDGFQCPHGVTYWIEPTGEQIARWKAGGDPVTLTDAARLRSHAPQPGAHGTREA